MEDNKPFAILACSSRGRHGARRTPVEREQVSALGVAVTDKARTLAHMSTTRPAWQMALPLSSAIAVVLFLVVWVISGSWWIALIVALVIAGLAAGALWVAADSLALRALGARPLAVDGSVALRNQLEELCARAGVSEPEIYTVGPGPAAMASFGTSDPKLVVTDGVSDDLTVVELEAVVARELGRIKTGMTSIDTRAIPFLTMPFGPIGGLGTKLLAFFRGPDHDARVDLAGVEITRYPPGLSAALKKMQTAGATPPGSLAARHLWAVDSEQNADIAGHFGVGERLDLLSQL